MSTEAQLHGHSLQRQKRLAAEYCARNGFQLVEELSDIGVSGFSGKHMEKGKLGQFFEALHSREIDPTTILLVENLDRLSRQDPLTAITQFTEILNYGIEIHTLFDQQVYTKESVGSNMGQLFLSIGQMIRAYDESKVKSQRLAAVWEKKRNDPSTYITAKTPSWIVPIKDRSGQVVRFALHEGQAEVVRKIFDLSINENMGSFAIARYLNERIDRFPKKKTDRRKTAAGWSVSYVKKILNSPSVFGEFQPMKIVDGKRSAACDPIKGYYPSVVPEEVFLLAQEKQRKRMINGRGRRGSGFPNVFSGLLKCAKCGSSIRYRDRGVRPKGTVSLHCCSAMQKRASCKARTVRYSDFERNFFSVLSDISFASALSDDGFKSRERELELKIASRRAEANEAKQRLEALIVELTEPGLQPTLKARVREAMNNLDMQILEAERAVRDATGLLEDMRSKPATEIHGELVGGVRELLAGTVELEARASLRSKVNHHLKQLIDVIYIDSSPWFDVDDVKDGLIEEEELSEAFVEWFFENRTDRWKYKTPLDFVCSEYGIGKYQEFETQVAIHFKNGKIRTLLPTGEFVAFDKKTGEEVSFGA